MVAVLVGIGLLVLCGVRVRRLTKRYGPPLDGFFLTVLACAVLAIVIPAYNESGRIPATLRSVVDCIRARGWDAEVVVVNDGSRDNTAEVVREFARTAPEVRLLENPHGVLFGLALDHVERAINDLLGDRFLAGIHDRIHELRDDHVPEFRIGKNLASLGTVTAGHLLLSLTLAGSARPLLS